MDEKIQDQEFVYNLPTAEWDDEEYRNLPPDSDLLAEWREHDRARGG